MKNKIGFKKLVLGFGVVLFITFFSAIASSWVIDTNAKTILHVNNDIYPFMDKLNKFEQIVLNSKMLITNWVYLQYNKEDKEELKKLIKEDYPQVKKEILGSLKIAGHLDNIDTVQAIFDSMDELLEIEKELMQNLVNFDDYEDAQKIFTAEEIIEEEVIPRSTEIRTLLASFIHHTEEANNEIRDEMLGSLSQLERTIIIFGFGMFVIILLSVIYIQKNITRPVMQVRDVLLKLSKGEITNQTVKQTDDVIAQMVEALYKLSDNFNKVAINAEKIGKGDFKTTVKPLSEKDVLGNAILEMKNSLEEYSEEMEGKVQERTLEISKQKEIIEKKNTNITASINYAERIQKASLPQIEAIEAELSNSFVLFKPKDIVSGDFYWFSTLGNKTVIAAVDCTGHGVPGAFMSLVGLNLLSAIVNESQIIAPDLILEELHKRIRIALRQDITSNQDGMDMSICVLDKAEKKIEFSGAKNPLVYIQNNVLFRLKGDKRGIGGKQATHNPFTKHTISFQDKTSFYLFSDGYQDQFGGENDRKFMIKNMENMFLENYHLPMKEQKQIYQDKIIDWMKPSKQIDDILMIGFQL